MYVNPSDFLAPGIALVVGTLPVLYFRRNAALFGIAALAYFVAIGGKVVVEGTFSSFFSRAAIPTYLAYGLLTFFLEVGLAWAFLRILRGQLPAPDQRLGWVYGTDLAFFENAILLGLLPLLELLAVSQPSVRLAGSAAYSASFLPSALPYLGERTASLIAHGVWGLVAYVAVVRNRARLLWVTLPLALLDSIASWWDFTHAVSYPVLIGGLLAYVLVASYFALWAAGLLPGALRALRPERREVPTPVDG